MGYFKNHLATVVTSSFAAILSASWPFFHDYSALLDFAFYICIPIAWFMAITCWLAQKSADYAHKIPQQKQHLGTTDFSKIQTTQTITYDDIKNVQEELSAELNNLKESVKLKDSEIEKLTKEISNLKTLVQIEALKTELANLKMLASKRK
jgi:virulence-associated protein VapD